MTEVGELTVKLDSVKEALEEVAGGKKDSAERKPREPPKVGDEHRGKTVTEIGVKGTVKWFNMNKGIGFIRRDDNDKDIFVHRSSIRFASRITWPASLDADEKVEFMVVKGRDREQAALVTGPDTTDVRGSKYALPYRYRFLIFRKGSNYVGPPPPPPFQFAKGYKTGLRPLPKSLIRDPFRRYMGHPKDDVSEDDRRSQRRSEGGGGRRKNVDNRGNRRNRSDGRGYRDSAVSTDDEEYHSGNNDRRRRRQGGVDKNSGQGRRRRRYSSHGVTPAQRSQPRRGGDNRYAATATDSEEETVDKSRQSGGEQRRNRRRSSTNKYTSDRDEGNERERNRNKSGSKKQRSNKGRRWNGGDKNTNGRRKEDSGRHLKGIDNEQAKVRENVTGSGDGPKSKAVGAELRAQTVA